MRKFQWLFLPAVVTLLSITAMGQHTAQSPVPGDDAILKILAERLGDQSDRVGIVVGVIEPAGRRIIAYGSCDKNDKRPLNGDIVFEIGSVTKVFTSLLLADMVERGEVELTDPVAKYLPSGVKMPERGGRAITLEDLSRHRSGLPRLPTNMDVNADPKNPYATYSVKQLHDFLSTYQLARDIGAEFEYSNLGGGLLGHVLSLAAGKDYETLIRTRICEPLGMNSTAITLSADMKSRMATGQDNKFEATPNWDLPTLAGAGALRSTANDMLSFLAAQIGLSKSELDPAMAETRSKWTPAGQGMEIGLGWLKRPKKGSEIIWHNGGTGGFRSFAGYALKAQTGVVVLSNLSTLPGVDDLGFHLLDPESKLLPPDSPLLQPPKEHTGITLDPGMLDIYVGKYEFAPNVAMTISRKDSQLFAQLTGQGAAEIYPESKTDFFYKVVDAQILFKTDSKGRANALVLRQIGRDQIARRVDGDADPLEEWFGHRVQKVDPEIFKNYVGRYQLVPGAIFTVTLEGDQLYVQLTGQPRPEVFPENEREFFLRSWMRRLRLKPTGTGLRLPWFFTRVDRIRALPVLPSHRSGDTKFITIVVDPERAKYSQT
jgi:D-alanyl-D-alanine-carboxypeptidase/D-alanyl-D-alanine-endopeptidase